MTRTRSVRERRERALGVMRAAEQIWLAVTVEIVRTSRAARECAAARVVLCLFPGLEYPKEGRRPVFPCPTAPARQAGFPTSPTHHKFFMGEVGK